MNRVLYAESQSLQDLEGTGNLKFHAGDLRVLSTDDLHTQIPESTLNFILNATTNLETKANSLVKAALDAVGNDNITIFMVQV